jgi:hypothetical protein
MTDLQAMDQRAASLVGLAFRAIMSVSLLRAALS